MSLLKKYLERMEETLSKLDLIIWTFSFLLLCMCKYSKYSFVPHHVNFYEIQK